MLNGIRWVCMAYLTAYFDRKAEKMKDNEFLSKIMGFINKAGIVVLQNLLFLVSCLPVVTIGAAWSGLYSLLRFQIRKESWFDGFKEGFKSHFLRNTVTWVVSLIVGYLALDNVLYYAEYLVSGNREQFGGVVFQLVGSGVFLLLVLMFLAAAIPVSLYIPGTVNDWLKNTWSLIFRAPLQVLACAVLMWAPVALALFFTQYLIPASLILIVAYFVLSILVMTILLKDPLIRILNKNKKQENPGK